MMRRLSIKHREEAIEHGVEIDGGISLHVIFLLLSERDKDVESIWSTL